MAPNAVKQLVTTLTPNTPKAATATTPLGEEEIERGIEPFPERIGNGPEAVFEHRTKPPCQHHLW